jgi:hypothetical protein
MFKTAPRYLSGVSVFYGDDITKRTVDGEIAFIVGQSKKGTRLPIQLRSVENAVPIYGVDAPLVKALHQFWDGYIDSPRAQNIKIVTMRVGGIPARLTTSYGLVLETTDAYDGIENDLYIYVDNDATSRTAGCVKVWDENLSLVYDNFAGVDAQYVTVIAKPNGQGKVSDKFGTDLENNPTGVPCSLASFRDLDYTSVTTPASTVLASDLKGDVTKVTKLKLKGIDAVEAAKIPSAGFVRLSVKVASVTPTVVYQYTSVNTATQELTLSTPIADNSWGIVGAGTSVGVTFIQSVLVKGDSQLNITPQKKYELFRNALLEIEQFTPDYIIPGGVLFDETSPHNRTYSPSTLVAKTIATDGGATTLDVKAAATWLDAGIVDIDGGFIGHVDGVVTPVVDQLVYTKKTPADTNADGSVDFYTLEIETPTFICAVKPTVTASITSVYSTAATAIKAVSGTELTAATTLDTAVNALTGPTATVGEIADTLAIKAQAQIADDAAQAAITTPSSANIAYAKTTFNDLASLVAAKTFTTAAAVTLLGTFKTTTIAANTSVNTLADTVATDIAALTPGQIVLKADTATGAVTGLEKLRKQGFIAVTAGSTYKYVNAVITGTTVTLTLDDSTPIVTGDPAKFTANSTICTKVVGACNADTFAADTTFEKAGHFEIGLGYVKETDTGGKYEFDWTDQPTPGYGLAHFGYLLANFCNSAAIGYNTPLTAMNTTLPTSGVSGALSFERSDIVGWIGNYPKYKFVAGNGTVIEKVELNGQGLLGNAILAGSTSYNRAYMNNKTDGIYVDPAYGLLLSDEEYVDGHEIKDTYFKVIDLGKFMIVGAGLLTFNNRASQVPYIDTCGIYSLGLLAGKPKDQGISFSQIGTSSNVTVGVVVHRKYYNDLANLGYVVITREKGLGWVINNGNSVARSDSGYVLISTTRIIKEVIEGKRASLAGFIGKALNRYSYEAAKTRIADGFRKDVQNGLLNGYTFDLQIEDAGQAIGKLYLKCSINPPFELTQVDIDTVIDRSVTSVTG